MAVIATYQQLAEALETTLNQVTGIGTVSRQPGTQAPWIRPPGGASFLWEVDVLRTQRHFLASIPGSRNTMQAARITQMVIEGWYPKSEDLNSSATWRNMLDSVLTKLEQRSGIGIPGLILENGPTIAADGFAWRTSKHQGDLPRLCHFCRILISYEQEYPFTTLD